ncbi:hypothetical protein EVAR_73161_1 [Eumeta japonica]|uniref:Regulatory protein zeste n=1 Tax=Eumeta variegata TaxID=151549 RepID=A0A4C1TGS8_EUMVA|nr:hypothetical protein EVAR_73161_1 [Eumeta japonica]
MSEVKIEDASECKRKRSSNWLEEDKMLLKQLIKEKVAVIENKNTDTNTNNKKKKAWSGIEESFNNMCQGSKRTLTQLKSNGW